MLCCEYGSRAQVVGQRSAAAPQLFREREFNFEKLGIGGLDLQFEQIFRRAFASRVFPPEMVCCTAPCTAQHNPQPCLNPRPQ